MKKISPETFDLLVRIATKFNEKSSVYAYVFAVTSVVFKQWHSQAGNIAGIISLTFGIVLWALSDKQIRALLTGQKPPELPKPTAPAPLPTDSTTKG